VAGGPVGATLQTEGNAGLAVAGNALPATLSVVVTKSDGRPATGFAPNGNHDLPAGYRLDSGFNVPPNGCRQCWNSSESCFNAGSVTQPERSWVAIAGGYGALVYLSTGVAAGPTRLRESAN
jgi:hypothetical protein